MLNSLYISKVVKPAYQLWRKEFNEKGNKFSVPDLPIHVLFVSISYEMLSHQLAISLSFFGLFYSNLASQALCDTE